MYKLHEYASELEQSGGRRHREEADGVGGGQGWVEKGKGGRTMTPLAELEGEKTSGDKGF